MKVKATVYGGPKGDEVLAVAECDCPIPSDIPGMVKKFGEALCADRLKKIIVIDYQAFMRGKMYDKKEGKIGLRGPALQAAVDKHLPSLKKKGTSFLDKVREKSKTMTPEEKAALLAELTGQAPSRPTAPARRPVATPTRAVPTRRPAATA